MNRSALVLIPLVFFGGLLVLSFQNCSKGFLPALANAQALQCRLQGAGTFSESKIQIPSSFLRTKAVNKAYFEGLESRAQGSLGARSKSEKPTLTPSQKDQAILPVGTELVAVVDVACAYQAQMLGYTADQYPISSVFAPDVLKSKMQSSTPEPANEFAMSFKLGEETNLGELRMKAESDRCVIGIASDGKAKKKSVPTITETQGFALQPFHQAIHTTDAWNIFYDNTNGISNDTAHDVTVGLIDTGVYQEQVDLSNDPGMPGGLFSPLSHTFVTRSPATAVQGDPNRFPDGTYSYHGTHVGGLIGAPVNGTGVVGIAPQHVKLMSLNVFQFDPTKNSDGTYDEFAASSDIYNAVKYAVDNGAQILNMSLGVTEDSNSCPSNLYLQGILYAAAKNVSLFVAAGNGYTQCDLVDTGTACDSTQLKTSNMNDALTPRDFPAMYARDFKNITAVGSTDDLEVGSTQKAKSSNYGTNVVAISAPGSSRSVDPTSNSNPKALLPGILSTGSPQGTGYTGNDVYLYLSGTSMATPMATAAAALAYSLYWTRTGQKPTAEMVKDFVTNPNAVDQVPALTPYFANGARLNLLKVANRVSSLYPKGQAAPTATPIPTPAGGSSGAPSASNLPPCANPNVSPTCE